MGSQRVRHDCATEPNGTVLIWPAGGELLFSLVSESKLQRLRFPRFNFILSRFVIAFLPRSKRLLISWLQLLSAVILEPKKIKSVTASTFPPSVCYEVNMTRFHDLSFLNVEF